MACVTDSLLKEKERRSPFSMSRADSPVVGFGTTGYRPPHSKRNSPEKKDIAESTCLELLEAEIYKLSTNDTAHCVNR
jgi:hypothetical protein